MVIDFGDNIMGVLMIVGAIMSVSMIITLTLISYSFTRIYKQQKKFDKEFDKWHY